MTSIQVNLIQSPHVPLLLGQSSSANISSSYNRLLNSYFCADNSVRLLYNHDVICIDATTDPAFLHQHTLTSVANPAWPSCCLSLVYFQVVKINNESKEGQCYSTAPLKFSSPASDMKVYLVSTINWCIPAMMPLYYSVTNVPPKPQVDFLFKQKQSVCDKIRPYLLHSALTAKGLSTATFIFQHSKSNSNGLETNFIIGEAARYWNMHVVHVPATDLLCEVSQTTEAKLRNVFARCKLFAPCILLLQDIHLLFKAELYSSKQMVALFENFIK